MRVVIVAHALRAGGGIHVGANIASGLPKARPEWKFLCVVPDMPAYLEATQQNNVHVLPFFQASLTQRLLFEQLTLPRAIRRFAPDIILSLGNAAVHAPARLQAMLLQDAHFVYPASHYGPISLAERAKLAVNRARLHRSLRRVKLVFLQTNCMLARFRSTWDYGGSLAILPNAVDRSARGLTPPDHPSSARQLRVLVLSRYYPHKNLELLLNTFGRHRKELHDIEVRLTISADQHPGARTLLHSIHTAGLEHQLVNVGPLPASDLEQAYRQVDAMLLPSLLESFSGTYLEAMQFGTPIVTTDMDFAREVCGNAAMFFDPSSTDSLAQALIRLRDNPGLRQHLAAGGLARLAELQTGWGAVLDRAASDLEDAYAQARSYDHQM